MHTLRRRQFCSMKREFQASSNGIDISNSVLTTNPQAVQIQSPG